MKFNSVEKIRVDQSDAVAMKNQGAHQIEHPANEWQACYRNDGYTSPQHLSPLGRRR